MVTDTQECNLGCCEETSLFNVSSKVLSVIEWRVEFMLFDGVLVSGQRTVLVSR